ncbi:MAG TPA: TonB family protein, partial [Acidobacteriota bacterium]|nr:TonB family protein [Acidobacteriota bacterium]
MSTFEKVGGFLLFERIEEDRLSKDMLAGQINGSQVQQVCVIKRFDSSLATLPDFITDLNQEYEVMKALSNPNIIKPLQFVQDKKEFAAVFDYVEGKTLRTVLKKCSQDGYPFTVDHALLVASRLCTALEYLHSKKLNEQRLIHGYVSPEAILITYDGEIRLQYLGLAHALLKFPAGKEKLFHDYKNYLAPELLNQQKWDKTIDIYGAGLVLYEMLTGEPLDRTQTLEDLINEAMMNSNSGEKMPLPDDLKKLLYQALAIDPANRFHSVSDMRKALDLSLFSSEFSPTTFNLAFFMHSLFRDSIDEETKKIGLYKKTDFSAHLKPEPAPVLAAPAPATTSASQPVKKQDPVGAIVDELHPTAQAPTRVIEHKPQPHHTTPANKEFFETPEEKEKSKLPIFAGLLLIVAVGAAIFYFFALKPAKTPTAKPVPQQPAIQGLTPEQLKLQAEERKKLEMDALKAQEEARKKDEELKTLQAKLDALLKAQQDEAKKKKQDEKASQIDPAAIKKLQQEAKRLEEEKKQQQALAEQKLKEAQAPPVVEQAQPESVASATDIVSSPGDGGSQVGQPELQTPTEAQPEPELIQPSVIEGQVVDLTPDVVKPEILSRVNPTYPPIAQQKKVEGTVIIGVLISERGDVAEAKVLRSAGGYGLNEAALTAVRKWRFRPAVKEGKRVKVWMTYPIV